MIGRRGHPGWKAAARGWIAAVTGWITVVLLTARYALDHQPIQFWIGSSIVAAFLALVCGLCAASCWWRNKEYRR